jgi:anion-transporting  ArsA/GET3 family ATPase
VAAEAEHRERDQGVGAADVQALLTDRGTAFLIVTSPERTAVDEAIRFAAELKRNGMHRSGVIVNRVHPLDQNGSDTTSIASRLAPALDGRLAETVARVHADVQLLARADQAAVQRLRAALRETTPVCLTDRAIDLHDIPGLADVHGELFA